MNIREGMYIEYIRWPDDIVGTNNAVCCYKQEVSTRYCHSQYRNCAMFANEGFKWIEYLILKVSKSVAWVKHTWVCSISERLTTDHKIQQNIYAGAQNVTFDERVIGKPSVLFHSKKCLSYN